MHVPASSLGPQTVHASLAPLAVQISAANLAGSSQPVVPGVSLHDSRTSGLLQQLPGVPVGSPQLDEPSSQATPHMDSTV